MMPAETFEPSAGSGPEHPEAEAKIERTFATGDRCRLVVENPRGYVHVVGWDRPEVSLQATKIANGSSKARFDATRIEVQQEGAEVIARTSLDVSTPFRERGLWNELMEDTLRSLNDLFRNTGLPAEVRYEVKVPRHADLDLKGVSSKIAVEGIRGLVRVGSVSGSATLEGVQGETTISTVSGGIAGQQLDGNVDAKSVSGSIRLDGRVSSARVNNVSGSIELASPLAANGSYDFHTVSGSLTLRVPADASLLIQAHGVSLAVTSDLPCEVLQDSRRPGSRRWQGRLGNGTTPVRFQTVSGHLYVARLSERTAEAAAPASHAAATSEQEGGSPPDQPASERDHPGSAPAASDTVPPADRGQGADAEPADTRETVESAQLRILRAIERGELPVDEALKQLAAIRGEEG